MTTPPDSLPRNAICPACGSHRPCALPGCAHRASGFDTPGEALYAMWVDGPGSDREAGYTALNPYDIEAWERLARGIVERPDEMRKGLLGVI